MEFNKILSEIFCQAAILALRDWAVEFETAHHVLYKYAPEDPRGDAYSYFMYSAHNEVRWWKLAEHISQLSALYIPFYAQTRGLDPKKLDDDDARRIFLHMMMTELEDSHRTTSMVNDYDTGFGYEGVLYALYVMGEEKAMQGFAKLSPEIKQFWGYSHEKYEPMDYAGMMRLEKLDIRADEQAPEVRTKMMNQLFGNLLRESLLTTAPDIANAAFSIQWEEVIDYQTEDVIKSFLESHPDGYADPVTACDAFFTALDKASKAAPLVQLISKTDADKLKQTMLSILPSYISYFERLTNGQYDFYCGITAPLKRDVEPEEINHDDLPF